MSRWKRARSSALRASRDAARRTSGSRARRVLRGELAIVLVLYGLWRIIGTISVVKVDGAIHAGQWIWDVERWMHLPSEHGLQHLFLKNDTLIQLCNVFYASVHLPSMMIFLVWLYFWKRPHYPPRAQRRCAHDAVLPCNPAHSRRPAAPRPGVAHERHARAVRADGVPVVRKERARATFGHAVGARGVGGDHRRVNRVVLHDEVAVPRACSPGDHDDRGRRNRQPLLARRRRRRPGDCARAGGRGARATRDQSPEGCTQT